LTTTATSLPVRPAVHPELAAWVQKGVEDGVFVSQAHGFTTAVGRLRDEIAVLASWCARDGRRLDWDAVRRTYADALAPYAPPMGGRPRKGVERIETVRPHLILDSWVPEWAEANKGRLFAEENPLGHALDAGVRLLRSVEVPSPVCTARFPFEEARLRERYEANLSTRKPGR
jgi:hypothetical protein